MDEFIPIMGILLVMIPVAGLTLAATLRFAIKPLVETLARELRDSGVIAGRTSLGDVGLRDLSEQMDEMRVEIGRLRDELSFERQLVEPSAARPPRDGADRLA